VPLVDLPNAVMGSTKRACHLHPILCTWDAVITCMHSSHRFLYTWGAVMLEKEKKKQIKRVECMKIQEMARDC